jgi:hypothetical protein
MFTEDELKDIEWLASLVKSQALSERNAADRLYGAYSDRQFVHSDLAQARGKIARCEAVIEAVKREKNA